MRPSAIWPALLLPFVAVFVSVKIASNSIALGLVIAALAVGATWAGLYMISPSVAADETSLRQALESVQKSLGVSPEGAGADPVRLLRSANETVDIIRKGQREHATVAATLDAIKDGLWITDGSGTIVRTNEALRTMLDGNDDFVGRSPISVLRSAELQQAVMQACIDRRRASVEVTLHARARTLAIDVAPLGAQLAGSAAVVRDVTALRKLEQVRTDFVANVSHELRTPITAIRGYAETLRGGALREPRHAEPMVEIIHRQSERLSSLVDDLLELSRLEAGERPLERAPVALDARVHRTFEAVRPASDAKQITLVNGVASDAWVFADAKAIDHVMLNLVENAVKFAPHGGKVEVSARRTGDRCEFWVTDNGPGLEPKHLSRIFERFYRVDKGRSREMGGTGLGLSIVKHLVSAMNGDVHVSSEPGKGATFTVSLPGSSESNGPQVQ